MNPRRTHESNCVYELAGGTEDNSLWVRVDQNEGTVSSVWELNEEERLAIAEGAFNIQLTIYGGQPPVAMKITNVPLGKAPDA